MFQVITPADDRNLLTMEELRSAVGLAITDNTQDEKLEALGLRVSAMISAACQVAGDGINPPTLLMEGCIETLRHEGCWRYLYLSRRPIAQVISVEERGVVLTDGDDYEVDAAAGRILRLTSGDPLAWPEGKIVVSYDAGYEAIPDDLKAIAAQLAGGYWADDGLDSMEKSLTIPGVIETTRWVDQNANTQMPADLMRALIDGGYVVRRMVL